MSPVEYFKGTLKGRTYIFMHPTTQNRLGNLANHNKGVRKNLSRFVKPTIIGDTVTIAHQCVYSRASCCHKVCAHLLKTLFSWTRYHHNAHFRYLRSGELYGQEVSVIGRKATTFLAILSKILKNKVSFESSERSFTDC